MRPSLNIISDELIIKIVDEAKRILAEIGMDQARRETLKQALTSSKTELVANAGE